MEEEAMRRSVKGEDCSLCSTCYLSSSLDSKLPGEVTAVERSKNSLHVADSSIAEVLADKSALFVSLLAGKRT